MKEIYDFNDLIIAFKTYILPTMESTFRNYNYIEKTVKKFATVGKIQYTEINGRVALTQSNYIRLLEMFEARYKYFNKEIELYSTGEVERVLEIKNINKIIKRGVLKVVTLINGQAYFNKEEIDKLKASYEDTYTIDE